MTQVYVFKDADGDYLVSTSAELTDGVSAFQLNGAKVDAKGGPIAALQQQHPLALLLNRSVLADEDGGQTVEQQAERLGSALAYSTEVDSESPIVRVLLAE